MVVLFHPYVHLSLHNKMMTVNNNLQYNTIELIEKDELKEGDLVFFHTRGRRSAITHVGVYLTNNKFVHASTSNGVSISDLDETFWKPRFRAGGRLVIPQ